MLPQWFRHIVRTTGVWILGRRPKVHRIPFGPLKGRRIFISFELGPRMYLGIDEPFLARWIEQFTRPGDVVYDIGAHVGYTCLLFAQRLGGSGVVHAFEIVPSIAGCLEKTVEANEFRNIVVHPVGLSDSARELELPVAPTGMASLYLTGACSKRVELCRTVPLDHYVVQQALPLPTVLKIDIEGAEMDCLVGAKETITKCLPRMFIEFHRLDLLKQGFSFLQPLGYTMVLPDGRQATQTILDGLKQFHDENVLCLPAEA